MKSPYNAEDRATNGCVFSGNEDNCERFSKETEMATLCVKKETFIPN